MSYPGPKLILNTIENNFVTTVTQHVVASFPNWSFTYPFSRSSFATKIQPAAHTRFPHDIHTIKVQCCLNNVPELNVYIIKNYQYWNTVSRVPHLISPPTFKKSTLLYNTCAHPVLSCRILTKDRDVLEIRRNSARFWKTY